MTIITKYVKRYVSPIKSIIEQHRNDGIIREVNVNSIEFIEWIENPDNVLEVIEYVKEPPKNISLEEFKKLKIIEIENWYKEELLKPLKVNSDPDIYIKQTDEDLNLWEKGIKGFLFNAYEVDYFNGINALTEEEKNDLFAGTIRGSIIAKAKNYAVNPIDYYGNLLYINLETMIMFTFKLAKAFQNNFTRYHLLKTFINCADDKKKINSIISWTTDLSVYGYPPVG